MLWIYYITNLNGFTWINNTDALSLSFATASKLYHQPQNYSEYMVQLNSSFIYVGTFVYVRILWIEVYNVAHVFCVACACVVHTYAIKHVILVILFYTLVTTQMTMGCTCCGDGYAHIYTCTYKSVHAHTCLWMFFWETTLEIRYILFIDW